MDTKTKFLPPFHLIRQDGWSCEFGDMTALAAAICSARIEIAAHHAVWFRLDVNAPPDRHVSEWIVRDDAGHVVLRNDIRAPYRPLARGYYSQYQKRLAEKQHAADLGLPIPGIHKRRWGGTMRHPKSFGVYRAKAAMIEEGREDIRVRGKIKLPPNAWDDIIRPNLYDRNWKRFRKTRWKNK